MPTPIAYVSATGGNDLTPMYRAYSPSFAGHYYYSDYLLDMTNAQNKDGYQRAVPAGFYVWKTAN